MLKLTDTQAIRSLGAFLREVGYGPAARLFVPSNEEMVFPPFKDLQASVQAASPFHRLMLSVFRQGHAASERRLVHCFGKENFDLFLRLGLLIADERGEYHTPSVALVDTSGLLLAVSLPGHYPTATVRRRPVYHGPETMSLARGLPASFAGKVVLDACSGTGLQSLICASRGARKVLGVDSSPLAVNLARFNAALNGFEETVEFQEADVLVALEHLPPFDHVVAQPPFVPAADLVDGGADAVNGTSVTVPLLERLLPRISQGAAGLLYIQSVGDQHRIFVHESLTSRVLEWGVRANAIVVSKLPLAVYSQRQAEILRGAAFDLPAPARELAAQIWAARMKASGAEFVYGTLLHLRADAKAGFSHVPIYDARMTDPLVAAVRMNRMAV